MGWITEQLLVGATMMYISARACACARARAHTHTHISSSLSSVQ